MYRRNTQAKRYFHLVLTTMVAVILASCTSNDIEKQSDALRINIDKASGLVCPPDHSVEVGYEINGGSSATEISCIPSGLWKAEVVEGTGTKGKIIVTAPSDLDYEKANILVVATDGERSSQLVVSFDKASYKQERDTLSLKSKLPDATFSIKTNFPVTPRIPSDIDWLSISEKSYADGILTFSVSATENTDYKRKASIDFVFSDEKVVSSLSIVQEGSKHGNVIYYTTSDDSPIDLLDLTEHSSLFPRDVVENNYENGVGVLITKEDIWSLVENAFIACENLESITLPETCHTIGSGAFFSCQSLKSFHVSEQIDEIGYAAFSACDSLYIFTGKYASPDGKFLIDDTGCMFAFAPYEMKECIVPEGVVSIGRETFENNKFLESVVLPSTVKRLEELAFCDIPKLKEVHVKAKNPPEKKEGRYESFHAYRFHWPYMKLYVPKGTIDAYTAWGGPFDEILEE